MTEQEQAEKRILEDYYNSMADLFATEGWSNLVSDLADNFSNINQVAVTKDAEDLNFRKGQLNILGFILNLETQISNMHQEQAQVDE
jgi:hypothetical protein